MKAQLPIVILALAIFAGARHVTAQGTAFTYQGQLNDGGSPANGSYDLTFTVHATNAPPDIPIAGPLTNSATAVSNGLFTVALDFGAGIFTGAPRWLEISVRTNGPGTFSTLTPRQALTPTPYAIMAGSASNLLGPLPSSQLTGSYGSPVNFDNGSDSFDGTFAGQFFGSTFTGGSFTGSFVGSGNGLIDVWHTTGNLGTIPGVNFLGTTDDQALELRVNNTRVLRLEPDPRGGNVGNLIGGLPFNAVSQQGSGGDVIAGGGFTGGANLILSNSSGVFIGAGSLNQAGPNVNDGVIAGGYGNTLQSGDSVMTGGYYNTIQPNAPYSFIGSGYYNQIQSNAYASFVGGGDNNVIQTNADHSIIAGGSQNQIGSLAWESVISGGQLNGVGPSAHWTAIGGGEFNTNNSGYAFIGGGYDNLIQPASDLAVIGGGEFNTISTNASFAFIGGGLQNLIQTNSGYSVIGGGWDNVIQPSAGYSVMGGGAFNNIGTNSGLSVVVGGEANIVQDFAGESFIGAGYQNLIQPYAEYSAITGGWSNVIQSSAGYSVIGGGLLNNIGTNAVESVVGGGYANNIQNSAQHSFIGGGYENALQSGAVGGFVGAGSQNTNAGAEGFIGAGFANGIFPAASYSFLGGGFFNSIQSGAQNAVIGGGYHNNIQSSGQNAVIAGGIYNQAGASGATVPGGFGNIALGSNSFAAGTDATALHDGSFVLTDAEPSSLYSSTTNQLSARFNGGVRFLTAGAGMTLDDAPVLTGPVASGELLGSYSNPLSFINSGNVFDGDGSGLANVNAATLNGLASSAFAQLNSSPSFTGTVSASALVVTNDAHISGLIHSGSDTVGQAPSPDGLVIRRVNSTVQTSNTVVAVARTSGSTANVTLVRDGSPGGFVLQYPASPGALTIACMGIDNTGASKNFYTSLGNPGSAGILQVYTNSQNVVHFECTFGVTFDSGQHLTQVTLSRYNGDYFWSGTLTSTYNQ